MNQKLGFFLEFKSALHNVAKHYLDTNDEASIWELSEKGVLFDLFQKHGDSGEHLNIFFKKVYEVIERRQNMPMKLDSQSILSGRYLLFDPAATMYDGLAEVESSGFFDSDDSPPPEFWVGVKDDLLIAFVPSDFIASANEGIDSCMSGCVEWSGESFTVSL